MSARSSSPARRITASPLALLFPAGLRRQDQGRAGVRRNADRLGTAGQGSRRLAAAGRRRYGDGRARGAELRRGDGGRVTSPEPASRPLRAVPAPRTPTPPPPAPPTPPTPRTSEPASSLIPGQRPLDDRLRRGPEPGRSVTDRPQERRDRPPTVHRHDHDHRRAPLAAAVERYRRATTVSFDCPSHRGGRAADPVLRGLVGHEMLRADVRLEPAELHRVRRQAEDLAASLWGAERAFFLGNGASGGNQAFLLATLRPGDEVVVARDAHVSTLTAIVMTGAKPVWVI